MNHSFHSQNFLQACAQLETSSKGLTRQEVKHRLEKFGENELPKGVSRTLPEVFLRQFLSPLIYVLVFASLLSWYLGHTTDALFIFAVLFINAVIGTIQEFQAERSAEALLQLTAPLAFVIRNGENLEVVSTELVPGDIVLLEADHKVPADIRLQTAQGLEVDESILTGESQTVLKDANVNLSPSTPVADQCNMTFSGSLISRGHGSGIVVATGMQTQLGQIAKQIAKTPDTKTPLLLRTEDFTKKLAMYLGIVIVALGGLFFLQGQTWHDTLLLVVALAVDAIPEGLPVALTVALSIASRWMAKKNVVVRKLSAVEALGSCTAIATDKTGTLTVNEQTVNALVLPDSNKTIQISGAGIDPKGDVQASSDDLEDAKKMALAALLCSDAFLVQSGDEWMAHGDAVDIAFAVLAQKLGLSQIQLKQSHKLIAEIPYESKNAYSATLHTFDSFQQISAKGSLEALLPMCKLNDEQKLFICKQEIQLASQGFRVLAVATRKEDKSFECLNPSSLKDLQFCGLAGLKDPLRPETINAVERCHRAGVLVVMVTGDHPETAMAIARDLGLASSIDQVLTGRELEEHPQRLQDKNIRVYARVTPRHKVQIVEELKRRQHFVSVTGDGANDAPALKAAHVGIAMGKRGTDVAKEVADLIITDDRFATIVDGIFHGRVAFNNVRKVVYLLLATGAGEIVLFTLSVLFGLPAPLTAVQVLWVNLVTNGIQDVALAFEPPEGNELEHPPRSPKQPLVDSILAKKILLSAAVIGFVTFWFYQLTLQQSENHALAQNLALLLMVLFGNIMIGNCRSETQSAFKISIFSNPILLIAALSAQGLHIFAMHNEWLGGIIGASPVTLKQWGICLLLAGSVLVAVEIQKFWGRRLQNHRP